MSDNIEMVDGESIVYVDNMCGHRIGIYLSSSNSRRYFEPKVKMPMKAADVRELNWQSGGHYMLLNYLRINDKSLAAEVGVPDDLIEYWYTEDDVRDILQNKPLDYLLDTLEFGPEGIVELCKKIAIELEIADNRKLEAIKERTGADINAIIRNRHAYDNVENEGTDAQTTRKRRVQQNAQGATTSKRRVKPQ